MRGSAYLLVYLFPYPAGWASGLVWSDLVWSGLFGLIWFVWSDLVSPGLVSPDLVWHGLDVVSLLFASSIAPALGG